VVLSVLNKMEVTTDTMEEIARREMKGVKSGKDALVSIAFWAFVYLATYLPNTFTLYLIKVGRSLDASGTKS
jgi:hypothetical protein